jgi:tubulin monoglycylase TTLL3/8
MQESLIPKEDSQKNSPSYTLYLKWKKDFLQNEDSKVFICDWNYPDISKALTSRGWVQNKDDNSVFFDLKYSRKARIPENLKDWQTLNHFPRNFELSAKWNLSFNITKKLSPSFLPHNHYFPRCFQMEGKSLQMFQVHFKVLFAVSMLKKFMIGLEQDLFKINAAIEIVSRVVAWGSKDLKISLVREQDWEVLTGTCESNPSLSSDPLTTILEKVRNLLESLKKLDPQDDLNGFQNIWIIKPGRKSRGRDIILFNRLEDILKYVEEPNYWVAQKYIENPLLVNNRKFDIRQWVLITNMDPLQVWVYKKCYLRFAAEDFSFNELSNNFRHLTNNSISKESESFLKGSSMWSIEDFQCFLENEFGRDVWTLDLFPKIVLIIKAVLRTPGKLSRKNSFELLGLDLMVSTDLSVWLLEVNTSPAMDYSTVILN